MQRVKWEPMVLMALVAALGVWLVWGIKDRTGGAAPTPGARTFEFRLGTERGVVEMLDAPPVASPQDQGPQFRVVLRNGFASDWTDQRAFVERYGQATYDEIIAQGDRLLFRLLNITSWAGLAWVTLGFAGQAAFFGRMFLQWVKSERERQSVVPPAFWWLSLIGGILLFTYFAWRQDLVGVLGQSSGLVIYARNIRLIAKQRRREREAAAAVAAIDPPSTGERC